MQLHVLFGSTTFWLAMVAKILGCVLHGLQGGSDISGTISMLHLRIKK
jgi:hypothetical protein